MDFFITIILAGLAGWLANLLYTNLDLRPLLFIFIGIVGGITVSFIFKIFKIPFLTGYLGTFGFALIGSLLVLGIISLISKSRSSKNYE